MTADGVLQAEGLQIVHIARAHPQTPERRGTQLRGGFRESRSLHNTVAGANVMEQVVAEGMDDLVSQGIRNSIVALVDRRAGGGSHDRFHMANLTANPFEERLPC